MHQDLCEHHNYILNIVTYIHNHKTVIAGVNSQSMLSMYVCRTIYSNASPRVVELSF